MERDAATPSRHRALFVSDVHLGSPGCKARQLAEFLRRNDCERLYLVGDIFDGWKLKSRFYWTPDHSRVIRAIISKARRGTRVYYLAGNHDGFMRQFVARQLNLGKIRLANEVIHTTADGRRLLVCHGDRFDDVVHRFPLLAHAGDAAYEALILLNERAAPLRRWLGLDGWSLSAAAKTRVKSAVQYFSDFDGQVRQRCRRQRLSGVVCGHTHHPEVRTLQGGLWSYNCGDWVESCTALAEDATGEIRILVDRPALQLAGAAPAGRRPLPWAARALRRRSRRRRRYLVRPMARVPAGSVSSVHLPE